MEKSFTEFVFPLLEWYKREKRDLPWRQTNDSYKIWISEIMLQQTRVEAVKSYYERFLKSLPTLFDLAFVEEDYLMKLWEGLGYYSRARNLKKCAQYLVSHHFDALPKDYEVLLSLPGIGSYTAGAIGSIAYGLKTPAIDGNVMRIMSRLYEDDRDMLSPKVRQEYFDLLLKAMPDNTRDFTESLMDLGSGVCLSNGKPLCNDCPFSFQCRSYEHKTVLEYPKKKPKKKRKIEEKTILILQYKDFFAIRKRPSTGLLASLYEFYSLEGRMDLESLQETLIQKHVSYLHIVSLGESEHVFSHLTWSMVGYLVLCEEKLDCDFIWVTKKDLQNMYSLPSAFVPFLKQL